MHISDCQRAVLVGNVLLHPAAIKECLRKSCYFLSYDPADETATLSTNHGHAQDLFELRGISYESAAKLAAGLGLKGEGKNPTYWSKSSPVLRLDHDGSENAELVRIEMLRLGVPHVVYSSAPELALTNNRGRHTPPMWDVSKLLEIVRDTAKCWEKELTATS